MMRNETLRQRGTAGVERAAADNELRAGVRGFFVGTFQVAIEAGAADAEHLRGADAVAFAGFEDALDVHAADFVERKRAPRLVVKGCVGVAPLEMLGQIGDVDEVARGGDSGAGENIFQLADVAGPVVLEENNLSAAGEAEERLAIGFAIFFEEMLDEERNVLRALGEAGNAQLDRAEAVEKIFAEASGENFGAQIAIRCGDHSNVNGADFGRADALDLAILNYAEQLGLHGKRSFADFIEEDGAAVGEFEEAGASVSCAGESAANVAEELAFEQRVDHSGTIADGEAGFGDGTHVVERVSDQFLAGAGGAGDENVGVMPRDFAGQIEHFKHDRAFADDAVKFEIGEELLF